VSKLTATFALNEIWKAIRLGSFAKFGTLREDTKQWLSGWQELSVGSCRAELDI